jgi:2-oxoglutarate dehydrogenase E2 component (dihydrolipoamide succinyltransferase)
MADTLVRMPRLADTLVEGTLGQWLKQVGDTVGAGEPLASIETDKVTTEMSSPVGGTLLELLIQEGQTVPVETVIARIGATTATTATAAATAAPQAPPVASPPPPRPTPVAARLLAEHGLRPEQVSTRPGRLTKDQVVKYIDAHPSPALRARPGSPSGRGESPLVPLTSMRRAIADHMAHARQTIPHGETVMDADLTRLTAWRELHKAAFQQTEHANLTFTVVFVYALARTLAADSVSGSVNLGVAVALEGGLIVPVLRDAGSLTLGATARGVADLAARARARTLTADETQGAHMTVTNVGSFGNLSASPIVPLGQVAIFGPGLVERRPMPGPDNAVRHGWRCRLCLVFDRRALDDLSADRLLRGVIHELYLIPDRA